MPSLALLSAFTRLGTSRTLVCALLRLYLSFTFVYLSILSVRPSLHVFFCFIFIWGVFVLVFTFWVVIFTSLVNYYHIWRGQSQRLGDTALLAHAYIQPCFKAVSVP